MEEIDGVGGGVDVTLNGTELDVATRVRIISSPCHSQISTCMLTVEGLARSAAGTIAISCELLTKVVDSGVSMPPCDHTTVQWWANVKVFDPAIVRVKSGLPTTALVGEIEMFPDAVPEESVT